MSTKIGLLFCRTTADCRCVQRDASSCHDHRGRLPHSVALAVRTYDLERAEPHPSLSHQRVVGTRTRSTKEAYLLVDAEDQLTKLVGKRVRVVGEADPAQVAEFHQMSPKVRIRTVRSNDLTPAVSDYGVLRVEADRFRVTSVNPTGDVVRRSSGTARNRAVPHAWAWGVITASRSSK